MNEVLLRSPIYRYENYVTQVVQYKAGMWTKATHNPEFVQSDLYPLMSPLHMSHLEFEMFWDE